ncbi:hypothetical protein HU200_001394 [Digitaria exilis]|uniref:F-box domain-containing protein n=1 Tax=Digitaria exilis TaxID=1010633 RepID=A0A835KWF1_9POAL|nr:hypothetical protein HU200_001394 [Digitaria exilis]
MDKSYEKQDHCDWISSLPDEILVAILHKVDTKTAVSTSLLSRRWRYIWTLLQSVRFSEVSIPANYCWVRLGPWEKEYLNANKVNHFVQSLQWFSEIKRGETTLRKLSLVFSGSVECSDVVNSAIASASERGVMHVDLAIVGHTKYEFPSWLFSGGTCSSLVTLSLNHCKFSLPISFKGFSSLTKLVLVAMHMSLKDTQVLLRNCTKLQSLHLIDISDIRVLQLPKLKELVWLWTPPCGAFKIDTPALRVLDYCGELLPVCTFQSLPCLEHVSLQYLYGDHPDHHTEKLQTISTRFPHVKSLHLRYQVPKVRYLSFLESCNGVVWDDFNFEHNSLEEVEMYNFKGRDNEIGFARLLLRRAPNMRRIAFSQIPLREAVDRQFMPPDWPRAEEFSPRDN